MSRRQLDQVNGTRHSKVEGELRQVRAEQMRRNVRVKTMLSRLKNLQT